MSLYGDMIDCEPRMATYANALREAITPGCTVIDIGASFGMFPVLACQYGAGKVIAIEPDSSAELIMPIARANGCADRIEVYRDISLNVELDEKADVILSDLRGTVPLFESHIPTIVDARTRLLKPGGRQLPQRDTIQIALISSPRLYHSYDSPWTNNNYGVDLSAARPYVVNERARVVLKPSELISDVAELAVLDYRTITDPNLDQTVVLTAREDGPVHGLGLWFDAEIAPGFSFSNAPDQPPLVYSQHYLPFDHPVTLKAGDRVEARIRMTFANGDYTTSWDSSFRDGSSGAVLASMRQSTFKSYVLQPMKIKKLAANTTPIPVNAMAIDREILALVDGATTREGIAQAIAERFPETFDNVRSALERVTKTLLVYDRESS